MSRQSKEQYEFGEFRLDVSERKLERRTGRTNGSLPEKAFQTLVHLVRNAGALVSKDELLSTIWQDTIVEENNVGKAIHAIRQCLGERSGEQKYIETVPKHGYRFVAEVKQFGNDEGSSDPASAILSKAPVRSPAWDLYLRGKVKAGSETREDAEAAIKVLEAAVEIDPELAGAYAQLARAYNTLAFKFSSAATAKRLLENAEVAILKALTLDPDLAEGHFARGLILWTKRKGFPHEQAIRSYQRSLELDPNDDETHHQLSMVYSHIGLLDEAQASVARALDLNPNNTMARFRAGLYCAYQGRFDEALTIFKTIPRDVSPMLVDRSMADVFVQMECVAEAGKIVEHYLDEFPKDEGGSFTGVQAVLLAKAGRFGEAEDAIARAVEIGKSYGHFHHTAHNIASAYAAMEKPSEAINWLEAAADDGFPNVPYFEIDPNLQGLRNDQRFQEFLNRLRPQWLRFKELALG
jgi:DNA-binding winged helix-turn-helix (wHTH) protein/Flp pilus assembly protein TadD